MGGEQHLSPQKGRDAGILYDVVVVAGKYSQPDSLWSIEDGIGDPLFIWALMKV
jgi:hypothetical protein